VAYQCPISPERRLARDGAAVTQLLREGSGPSWLEGDDATQVIERYVEAMAVPFVAHAAMEYFRWVVRSQPRRDGRAFREAGRQPVHVPVLHLQGTLDPWVLPASARGSKEHTCGPYEYAELEAGHFLPEEASGEVTDTLLRWLDTLPSALPAT
jgi:pimeloyl-ACP methyl ester carboxylesterase